MFDNGDWWYTVGEHLGATSGLRLEAARLRPLTEFDLSLAPNKYITKIEMLIISLCTNQHCSTQYGSVLRPVFYTGYALSHSFHPSK
jgi:hypothetical protein